MKRPTSPNLKDSNEKTDGLMSDILYKFYNINKCGHRSAWIVRLDV